MTALSREMRRVEAKFLDFEASGAKMLWELGPEPVPTLVPRYLPCVALKFSGHTYAGAHALGGHVWGRGAAPGERGPWVAGRSGHHMLTCPGSEVGGRETGRKRHPAQNPRFFYSSFIGYTLENSGEVTRHLPSMLFPPHRFATITRS